MRTMTTERADAMDRLKPRSKAAKLRAQMRLIEAKIEEGVQHADILQWLHGEGLVMTERTYQSYLYRYRRMRRAVAPAESQTSPAQAVATPKPQSAGRRPRTFNYDPKGNPDLLK